LETRIVRRSDHHHLTELLHHDLVIWVITRLLQRKLQILLSLVLDCDSLIMLEVIKRGLYLRWMTLILQIAIGIYLLLRTLLLIFKLDKLCAAIIIDLA
jgi:hypothetical protein